MFFLAVDTHQFQGNCSPHYWKVLPECQLRGKFLTSHHTNKQCAPLPLIKGSVSADRESGGGRGEGKEGMEGEREAGMEEGRPREREERRQEIWCSQRNAFGPPFVPKGPRP